MTDDNVEEELRERFGDQSTENYIKLQHAVHSLVQIGRQYFYGDEGTPENEAAKNRFDTMVKLTVAFPDKAEALIEALVVIILSMRQGDPYEEWFARVGIDVTEETGRKGEI